jgi:hypothetical protein
MLAGVDGVPGANVIDAGHSTGACTSGASGDPASGGAVSGGSPPPELDEHPASATTINAIRMSAA